MLQSTSGFGPLPGPTGRNGLAPAAVAEDHAQDRGTGIERGVTRTPPGDRQLEPAAADLGRPAGVAVALVGLAEDRHQPGLVPRFEQATHLAEGGARGELVAAAMIPEPGAADGDAQALVAPHHQPLHAIAEHDPGVCCRTPTFLS